MRKVQKILMGDSLYRNSAYLVLSNILVSGLGFVFWAISARVFSTQQIGIATTLISTTTLITVFSLLGLNISLIRFLPASKQKNDKINSSFTVIILASITASIIFLVGLKYFAPDLFFIRESIYLPIIFILFVIFTSLSETIKNVFRAFLSTQYILLKNAIFQVLKILLLFTLISFGAIGIYASWMSALAVSFLISLILLSGKFNYKFQVIIKKSILKKMFSFSLANYINEFFERLQKLALPLIITTRLGAEFTAYYFISMTVSEFLFVIPQALSASFFAEGSTNEVDLKKYLKKVTAALSIFLIPSIFIVVLFGNYILLFFGKNYSTEGFKLLQLLALSTVFVSVNSIFGNLVKIKFRVKELILINLLGALVILGLSYHLLQSSILGVGWAWLTGQIIMTIIYLSMTFLYKDS